MENFRNTLSIQRQQLNDEMSMSHIMTFEIFRTTIFSRPESTLNFPEEAE